MNSCKQKCHAATLTNDIARTIEVSTPAVMLGLSFANDIFKKFFSYMMLVSPICLLGT